MLEDCWLTFVLMSFDVLELHLTWELCHDLLQAQSRSAWAAKGSMVFLLLNLSKTNVPSHATMRDPCIGLSSNMYHTVNRSPYRLTALLLKELWSPLLPGTVIVPMIWSVLFLPLIIQVHAPLCSGNDPSNTTRALSCWIASQILWLEPIFSIFKFQSLTSIILLMFWSRSYPWCPVSSQTLPFLLISLYCPGIQPRLSVICPWG